MEEEKTLPSSVSSVLSSIAEDKISGSSTLAKKGLEAYIRLAEEEINDLNELNRTITKIDSILSSIRPSMPLIKRFSNEFTRLYIQSTINDVEEARRKISNYCDEVMKTYEDMLSSLVKNAKEVLREYRCVLTLSQSGTVLKTLRGISNIERVIILESRPRCEGLMMAKELSLDKKVIVYVDAAMSYAVEECDAVILGADAVFHGLGFLGKIGCKPLSLLASRLGKPVYVLADRWKFSEKQNKITVEEGEANEVWPEADKHHNILVRNPYFEITPNELINSYITDSGVVKGI